MYARKYTDLVRKSYLEEWWILYNCPDTPKWMNVLGLVEPLFTIPLSNGHLERCFSQLKLTKTDRMTCLKEDRLGIAFFASESKDSPLHLYRAVDL